MNPELEDDASASRLTLAFQQTFLSLRNRNFRLYFTGQLVSNTGNWLTNVALTLLVLHITGSGFAVGLLAVFGYFASRRYVQPSIDREALGQTS